MTSSLPISPDKPWLAPLAGWSDLPLRLLCRRLGAAVSCTEMISAKGLVYGGRNTEILLQTCPEDEPVVAQIFGAEPDFLAQGVEILKERGFKYFDLNLGCSVPKVTKTGSGAALLKDMDLALAAAAALIKTAGPGRAGCKIRLGWDQGQEVWLSLGLELQKMGAAWLSLHPRYAKQSFRGLADHQITKELAKALQIPVIASGDLFSAQDAWNLLQDSPISGVMYARAALNDPAIFAKHQLLFSGKKSCCLSLAPGLEAEFDLGPCSRQTLAALIRSHAALAQAYSPEQAVLKMRTIVPRYIRHLDGAKALRQRLIACRDWATLEEILEEEFGPA